MAAINGFNRRVHDAFADLKEATGRQLKQEDLAEMVALELGGEAVSGTTVGRWMRYWDDKGAEPKTLEITASLARVLGVPAGWLAFGEGDRLGGPIDPATSPDPIVATALLAQRMVGAKNAADEQQGRQKGKG